MPSDAQQSRAPVVAMVSLGCAKNQVDSECVLGALARDGFIVAADPAQADICLVNTCGFIEDARREAQATLEQVARLKASGRLKWVVAMGCLVERLAKAPDMASYLAVADETLRFGEYACLGDRLRRLLARKARQRRARSPPLSVLPASYMAFLETPRLLLGSGHSVYLKIAEGCSNPCQFCSIPQIRGRLVSRPMEVLVEEARLLAAGGAREINVIAQDTTAYGKDLYGRPVLVALLRRLLASVASPVWFRLLYAYPAHLSTDLFDVMAEDARLCPYLDLPLQHISDRMLKAMGRRPATRDATLRWIDRFAQKVPEGALRTAFIVGFPGETDRDFDELLAFVKEGRVAHLGVFTYSSEPGTPAARRKDKVPPELAELRRDELMQAQQIVSRSRLRRRVGRIEDVLVDGSAPLGSPGPLLGRTRTDAPDVDGVVYLRGPRVKDLRPGDRVAARIAKSLDYDLVATQHHPRM